MLPLSKVALSLRNVKFGSPAITGIIFRSTTDVAKVEEGFPWPEQLPVIPKDGPERDLVNFPRPKQAMYGGKVRMGFLPEEWFQFFYKKTGVTGPYLFGTGLITFLMSKEYFIVDHEFHGGVTLAAMGIFVITKYGKQIGELLQKEMEEDDARLPNFKKETMANLEESIQEEKKAQQHALSQKVLFAAKRENVLLQLEAEYRHRMSQVYEAFKKRLDYQIKKQESKKNLEHKHMVNWIINSVTKSITPAQEADALKKCISDLKILAASVH